MATKVNFTIDQGADLSKLIEFTLTPVLDLSTYTARGSMRKHYGSNTAYTLTCAITSNTSVTVTLNNSNTAAIPAGRYVYDIEVVSSGNVVTRAAEGMVTVYPEVTR